MAVENTSLSIKSNKIMHDNMHWLLSSDIRIKSGSNKGALYGWKNLNPPSFPFVYSEITGYAITYFSWIASEFGITSAVEAAIDASDWIIRNMQSNLLVARPPATNNESNNVSDLFYSFDNSMILIGVLSLYKLTKKGHLLELAEKMAWVLINRFFDDEKMIPRLDKNFKPIEPTEDGGLVKWSTVSGAYHCKISLGLLELSKLSDNRKYASVSNSLCRYAKRLQKSDGRFTTNPGSDIVYLHPHLYACEGLIHSGLYQSNEADYAAGLNGIKWAIRQISSSNGGLHRDTGDEPVEQSDCTAQLLRLLILCQSELQKSFNKTQFSNIIEMLHLRLLDFYIPAGVAKGAMKYQLTMDTACSWCTMFTTQALKMWESKGYPHTGLDYFV